MAVKCDRCTDRDEPACVAACPTRALVFAEEEAFAGAVRAGAAAELAAGYAAGQVA